MMPLSYSHGMDALALYRKYRPQTFDHLVGQEAIRQTLLNALKNGIVSHAYLFSGPRGTGKTTAARLIAKALLCAEKLPTGEPCDHCAFCTEIKENRLIDLVEIDAASNGGVDEIRDLKEKISFAPTRGQKKVYIIDEVHMLSKGAFNALLKTLEEPPTHTHFILATTELHKVPETILSRCQRFDFHRIEQAVLVERLRFIADQEKIAVDDDALGVIADAAHGGLRDGITTLEQLSGQEKITIATVHHHLGMSGNQAIEKMFALLSAKNAPQALLALHDLYNQGHDLPEFLRGLVHTARDKMIAAIQENDHKKVQTLLHMIGHLQDAHDQLKNAVIPQLPVEVAIVKISIERADTDHQPKDGGSFAQKISEVAGKIFGEHKAPATATKVPTVPTVTPSAPPLNTMQEKRTYPRFVIENIHEYWPRVLEQIKTPSIRRSLQECRVVEVKNNTAVLQFTSAFHREKIDNPQQRHHLALAMHAVFGIPVNIECTHATIDLGKTLSPAAALEEAIPTADPELLEGEHLAQAAEKLFYT